jgi:hypothetical protein
MTTEGRRAYALLLGPFNGPKWPVSRDGADVNDNRAIQRAKMAREPCQP